MKSYIFSVIVLAAVCWGLSGYLKAKQKQATGEIYEGLGYLALVCLISTLLPSPHIAKQHDN